MPIYEYSCRKCSHQFETLVRPQDPAPVCAACGSDDLERMISLPAVKSESTHALALKAAKKRDKKSGEENARAQREYELHHND
jgi:putative FmdB family regulatory protein